MKRREPEYVYARRRKPEPRGKPLVRVFDEVPYGEPLRPEDAEVERNFQEVFARIDEALGRRK